MNDPPEGASGTRPGRVRLLLDVVSTERDPGHAQNQLTRGDNPFDPVGLRLFTESSVNDRVDVFAQTVIHDATGLYLEGAYVMFTPDPKRDLHLLAGKLPWEVGTWGPRTYSNKNPLIGIPLIYSHHTSLLWADIPPIVDDSYWDVGVSLTGSQRPFEYTLGIHAGAPGWPSINQDDNTGKTVLGRMGVALTPGLRAGVSGAYGPLHGRVAEPRATEGQYRQRLQTEAGDGGLRVGNGPHRIARRRRAQLLGDADRRHGLGDRRLRRSKVHHVDGGPSSRVATTNSCSARSPIRPASGCRGMTA